MKGCGVARFGGEMRGCCKGDCEAGGMCLGLLLQEGWLLTLSGGTEPAAVPGPPAQGEGRAGMQPQGSEEPVDRE